MRVPLRQLPLDSSLQGIDYWGMSRPAGDQPFEALSCRTDSLFPNAPPGSIGEEAKLFLRGTGRQPGIAKMASDPFAKSNNFNACASLFGSGQA